MVNRRGFISLLACAAAAPRITWAQARPGKVALYASVGAEFTQYDVNVDGAELVKRGSVTLPAGVQYAWPHVSSQYLYVASSNGGVGLAGAAGDRHHASAFRIDPSGALRLHGDPISLPSRPIHISTDRPSEHVLIAYNNPSGITVHRINRDGTLGDEVKQRAPLDAGIYAHQTRVTPSNKSVILVTRGNDAGPGKAEDPGALKIFDFNAGLLTGQASIAPRGGYGFGPRHLDFHPSQPWIYVSLERQNQLWVYQLDGDRVNPGPLFKTDTLADPARVRPRQLAGTVHVHPNGRFVYGVNRADGTTDFEGNRVFIGGENNIAVYAIDQGTGEPRLIQSIDTRGIHARTFHIDPSGRMLVAANIMPLLVRDDATVRTVPASLSVFRIGSDGKLEYARKYDVDVGTASMFWMGMVKLQ
ncbi:MAG TPA: beta-propeller fold lactonase family protein [Casimicrobiaceae bacterium]|jgi:6-phosphogluconolactonase (cycloisomerase 2 family)